MPKFSSSYSITSSAQLLANVLFPENLTPIAFLLEPWMVHCMSLSVSLVPGFCVSVSPNFPKELLIFSASCLSLVKLFSLHRGEKEVHSVPSNSREKIGSCQSLLTKIVPCQNQCKGRANKISITLFTTWNLLFSWLF